MSASCRTGIVECKVSEQQCRQIPSPGRRSSSGTGDRMHSRQIAKGKAIISRIASFAERAL